MEIFAALLLQACALPGILPRALTVRTQAREATMAEDFAKASRDALERANEVSEVAIFWGLILTVVVVAVAMFKGMIG